MAGSAGWYVGRIDISSVAAAKGGSSTSVTDTVFLWSDATTAPTVATANITGLVAITAGPYPTQAMAKAAAEHDPNTTTGVPGTGPKPPVSTSTVGSSNGKIHVPNLLSGWTHNIEQWIVRGFEMLLGLGLIIVSLAKLASDTPAGKAAVKVGTAAAIL